MQIWAWKQGFPNPFSMQPSKRTYGGNLLLVTLLSHYCFYIKLKSSTGIGHMSANTTPQWLQWEDQVMGLAVSCKWGGIWEACPLPSANFTIPEIGSEAVLI